ncbi:unnamed protein product [Ceutorhynchus assimilis]|uniref:non-specific serine/threonine protein kinase n=1 Tax=Ceutorhynchus assimilis TaxID=467358 RepID=A0A9N9M855_9CUCU|nr:unnamed protein product [Ceutorhynchus assimilis]
MWPKIVVSVVAFKIMCSIVDASSNSNKKIPSLPYCPNKNRSGAVLVGTLDGKLSAISSSGSLSWQIETGPGPLLVSNIHKLELTNNGEWIRIIPSLTGTLYKFDGNTIDPISISAEALLRSSFRYSDDLVIAGGIEVRTYGVSFHTGKLVYECTQSKCSNHEKEEMADIMVVERSTQTIRAVEPRTGNERWNFSVGLHNVKLPQVSCIDTKVFDANISAVIPEGLLSVSSMKNNKEQSWQYKFQSPIVRVWKWDGIALTEINLFESKNMPGLIASPNIMPSIYIGMHKKQLYVHESLKMQHLLQGRPHTQLIPAESHSIAKIPWKPVAASTESTEDDSTALSVLNNSEYVNGNGYYLYSESELEVKNNAHCDKNDTIIINKTNPEVTVVRDEVVNTGIFTYLGTYGRYYKEFLMMVASIMLGPILLFRVWNKSQPNAQEIIVVEKPVEAEIIRPERQISEKSTEGFTSRFEADFTLIDCLGKGGFGIVFRVKQKYDDCDYAIKRITLNEKQSRDKVMREVKTLAKLEHKNIIRYFSSWVERPPLGWEQEHDKNWVEESYSGVTSARSTDLSPKKRVKSFSISIDIPLSKPADPSFDTESYSSDSSEDIVFENIETSNKSKDNITLKNDDDDSFIVFEDEASSKSLTTEMSGSDDRNDTIVATDALSMSNHLKKKINWKRPGRKHHSWDSSQNAVPIIRNPPMYLYIQMQLCQKESLKEWLSLNKTRELTDMRDIFLQILDAVEYVHSKNLIHRDLKPSNIFFSLEGQIKVGDFGLAKDIENLYDLELTRRSTAGSYKGHTKDVGTTLYMSPEQSNGRIYDNKVDIYALGVILFELLVPFSTDMERIITLTDIKTQKFPSGFSDHYPAEYDLVRNMLDENPNNRLTTSEIRNRDPLSFRK